ncbi:MAG: glycosyltransferase [Gammaproteobacteria bacterium]
MRIAMLSPNAWRTPPRHYGPWENVVSLLSEELLRRGVDVTLFATADSITSGTLQAVCPRGYEEDRDLIPKVWECLHISALFERADEYDLIHNHFDYLPLSYSAMTSTPLVSTLHGFSSAGILPVYEKYNDRVGYVSISDADRAPQLNYLATVHHGIDLGQFEYRDEAGEYLLFFGRIHHDKGACEAIRIAHACGKKLILAGIIQDKAYFKRYVEPLLEPGHIEYLGSVGPGQRNRLLGGALALLHPIQFNEPFGLAVIESMACGTPVVAFNRGSMPELILDGVNGFLVADVEQATAAIAQLDQLNRADCRAHVEKNFSVERMADDYQRVYQTVIGKTARESHRPWGYYRVLADAPDYKTKEIIVYPGKRLSLQRHRRRAEHWLILEGRGEVTLDEHCLRLEAGKSVDIPRGARHRIANPDEHSNLRFIEVQTGDYFGEDDIERFADDYGRT